LLLAYFIGEVRVFEVGIFVVDGEVTDSVVGQFRCRCRSSSVLAGCVVGVGVELNLVLVGPKPTL
jgi:hypothetical protein